MGGGLAALFPHLRFNPASSFHTSALSAAAMDTMTLPYRLTPGGAIDGQEGPRGGVDMGSLVRMLARTPYTSVAAAAMAMPAANLSGQLVAEEGMDRQPSRVGTASCRERRLSQGRERERGNGVSEPRRTHDGERDGVDDGWLLS